MSDTCYEAARVDPVNQRRLGRTGLLVSELGFGAGMVAGLFVRGTQPDQLYAAKRAFDLGINHFDTAPLYGDGSSETNLGEALQELGQDIVVGTKVEYLTEHFVDFEGWTRRSVESSLSRLRRGSVDVLYLHNNIRHGGAGPHDGYEAVTPEQVLGPGGIADALDLVRSQGLARFIGFTGTGDADAVLEVLESGRFDVVQAYYSLLNPSGSIRLPESSPLHNFRLLISQAATMDVGVVAIRVMGGGVLGGAEARQGASGTTSSQSIHGLTRQDEIRQAELLNSLSAVPGSDLRDLAVRFAITNTEISSALIGFSTIEQIEAAINALAMGPLSESEFDRLHRLWTTGFA